MLSNSRISWRRGTSLPQPRLSSRGLSPGPNALAVQAVVETLPLGIAALAQSDFPGAGPLLHRLLALYRTGDLLVRLDMDQARDAVFHDEARADTLPVFPTAAGDVVGDADVERTVLAPGKVFNLLRHRPARTSLGAGPRKRAS